jgi:GntR family transcriptional regulator
VVETEARRATIVRERRPLRRVSSTRYSRGKRQAGRSPLRAAAEEQGIPYAQRLLGVEVVKAPDEIADRLGGGVEAGQVVVRRHQLLRNGEPVQRADSYVPLAVAEGSPIERVERIPAASTRSGRPAVTSVTDS